MAHPAEGTAGRATELPVSMWTYPWDCADLGPEAVLEELAGAGFNAVSLATVYHAGRFLQARSPRRRAYFPEDGTVYFRPQAGRWRRSPIRPLVASLARERILDRVQEAARARGFALNSWTVCLHNTPQGLRHPDVCVQNAYGDRYFYNLCPSQPAAQAYLEAIASDLSAQYQFGRLELESPNFMGWDHEFHHEKDGVGLTPWQKVLLSLCFCPACQRASRDRGLDPEAARRAVRAILDRELAREVPAPDPAPLEAGPEAFTDDPDLLAYIRWRATAVTEAVRVMKQAAGGTPVYFLSLVPPRLGWTFGIDFAALATTVDGVVLTCYESPPDVVRRDVADTLAAVGPGVPVHAGFRLFFPEVRSGADLAARVQAAYAAGAGGFVFYNYGLVPAARLGWVRQAVGGLTSRQGGGGRE